MTGQHVVTLSVIPQPMFPDHCFSCGAKEPGRFVEIQVRSYWGLPLAILLWPWLAIVHVFRVDPKLRVPACSRCETRFNRARAIQFLSAFAGVVLLVLAAVVAATGGSSMIARVIAWAGGIGFAIIPVAWIWEGARVPLLVSAHFDGGGLQLEFDDVQDKVEFKRLNQKKVEARAG